MILRTKDFTKIKKLTFVFIFFFFLADSQLRWADIKRYLESVVLINTVDEDMKWVDCRDHCGEASKELSLNRDFRA